MPQKPSRKRDDLTVDDLRGDTSHSERRREARVTCDKPISILPCRAGENWGFFVARMFDCSPRGIGIDSETRIPEGDQFMVRAKLDVVRLLVYSVRRCVAAGSRYTIGAELNRIVGMDAGHQTDDFLIAMLTNAHPTEAP